MGANRKGGWIGGTAIVIVITFVATWFLAVSPRFEAAARTLEEAAEVESRNTVLEMQVASLQADYARIDELRAELANSQLQIPDEADLDGVLFMIDEHAVASAITIVEIAAAPSIPVTLPIPLQVVEPVEPVEPADDPASEDADPDGTIPPEPTAPTEPTAPPQIEGFVAIPIVVKVLGTYPSALAFLERMQTAHVRLFLVTGLKGVRQENQVPASGKPATVDGDLELEIAGFAYVLVNPLVQSVLGDDEETTPEQEPSDLPPSDRNPFIPLVPSNPAG